MSIIKHIVTRGIGMLPGKVHYIVTQGFATGTVTIVQPGDLMNMGIFIFVVDDEDTL